MAGLPPWLQKGQDMKGKDSPGDMKKAAAKGAIAKRIAKNSKKKGAAPNPFGAK